MNDSAAVSMAPVGPMLKSACSTQIVRLVSDEFLFDFKKIPSSLPFARGKSLTIPYFFSRKRRAICFMMPKLLGVGGLGRIVSPAVFGQKASGEETLVVRAWHKLKALMAVFAVLRG